MSNPPKWYGMRYPDSELVGLLFRHARPARPGLRAIDVGCGSGRHIRLLAELGYDAMGIDRDPAMVEKATANGCRAIVADVRTWRPDGPVHLVAAWGLAMLLPDAPQILAGWRPQLIVADWRTENNNFLRWPANRAEADGGVLLHNPGHILDGQKYFFHTLDQCQVPGYQRTAWQRVTRTGAGETNEWYQTVHERAERT